MDWYEVEDEIGDWLRYYWHEAEDWLSRYGARLGIFIIKLTNRYKDGGLSWQLHSLANQYARTPTNRWE